MTDIKKITIDENSPVFAREGMFYKKFSSDFRQIRYYTLLIVQKAPAGIREINLLEQQISEIIKNAIKHGNRNDPKKSIQVWFTFSDGEARLIVQDEGKGFQRLEEWNRFNRKRTECFVMQNFEEMEQYVSYRTPASDDMDSGNALFAALEYWNGGVVFNKKRNCVAVLKTFPKRRHGMKIS
jgi:serine/threonine-protein kinase RsbW